MTRPTERERKYLESNGWIYSEERCVWLMPTHIETIFGDYLRRVGVALWIQLSYDRGRADALAEAKKTEPVESDGDDACDGVNPTAWVWDEADGDEEDES